MMPATLRAQEEFLAAQRSDPAYVKCPTYGNCYIRKSECVKRWRRSRSMAPARDFIPGRGDVGCSWCRVGAELSGVPFTPPPPTPDFIGLDRYPKPKPKSKAIPARCKSAGCYGMVDLSKNQSGYCDECSRRIYKQESRRKNAR